MSGLPDPAGGSASPRFSPASAAVRLSSQLHRLASSSDQAVYLARELPDAFAARAVAVFLRGPSTWIAAYSRDLGAAPPSVGGLHDPAWIELAAAAVLRGDIPNELARRVERQDFQWISEPIEAAGGFMGALAVCLPVEAAPETQEALQLLARQLATTCHWERVRDNPDQQPSDAQALRALGALCAQAAPSQEHFREAALQIAQLMDSDACTILRLDEDPSILTALGGFGLTGDPPPPRGPFPLDPDGFFALIVQPHPVHIHAATEGVPVQVVADTLGRLGVQQVLGMGLVVNGQTVGLLEVMRRSQYPAYGDADKARLESVAALMGLDVERNRLRRTVRRILDTGDAVLRHLPDALVVYNLEGRVVSANETARRLTGGVVSAGRGLDEIRAGFKEMGIRIDGNNDPLARVEATLRFGGSYVHRRLHVTRAGHPDHYLDFSSTPILDAQGDVSGAVVLFRDVTAQQEIERRNEELLIEMEVSESRFRAIINTLDSAIMVRDAHSVLYTNESYRRLFGLERDVVGMPLDDLTQLLAPFFVQRAEQLGRRLRVDDLTADAFTVPIEMSLPVPRSLERTSSPLRGGDGEVFGRLVVFRDVTRERDQIAQRERFLTDTAQLLMGDLGLPKGELARLLAELDGLKAADNGQDQEIARHIAEVTARIQLLDGEIGGVLARVGMLADLPRALSHTLTIPAERHDLADTALTALRSAVELTTSRLRLEGFDRGPVDVMGNRTRVLQIVRWLAENAVAYSKANTPVTVRLGKTREGNAKLEMTDRGIGLNADEAERLFTCFYRSKRAIDERPRGMGISLYLASEIVRPLGGSLRAESRGPYQGTTFVLELPVARGQ